MTWTAEDEAKHPRDRLGQWAEKVANQMFPPPTIDSSGRARGRDIRTELDYDDLIQKLIHQDQTETRYSADLLLEEIYRHQGFDGKPQVVSRDELDEAVEGGWTELWRGVGYFGGVDASEYAERFRSEDRHWGGKGIYGNGTYATPDVGEARGYATGDDGLIRMAVRPQARVIQSGELATLWDDWFEQIMDQDYGGDDTEADDDKRISVLRDVGRFAAALGYDIIHEPSLDYYIILNRTAVWVQEAAS